MDRERKEKKKKKKKTSNTLPLWLSGKESACSAGDLQEMWVQSMLGSSPQVGNGNTLQYSCLGNPWTEEADRLQTMGS